MHKVSGFGRVVLGVQVWVDLGVELVTNTMLLLLYIYTYCNQYYVIISQKNVECFKTDIYSQIYTITLLTLLSIYLTHHTQSNSFKWGSDVSNTIVCNYKYISGPDRSFLTNFSLPFGYNGNREVFLIFFEM